MTIVTSVEAINTGDWDPIETISHRIRHRLYGAHYACLTSFFADLKRELWADEVGLFSLVGQQSTLRRVVPAGANVFNAHREMFAKKVVAESSKNFTYNAVCRYLWLEEKAGGNGRNVFFRRIWPSSSWRKSDEDSFWLYVVAPAIVMPQVPDAPSDELVQKIGGLVSAFIRWKNEIVSLHDEILSAEFDKPETVLPVFKSFMIRPVTPSDFRRILESFRPVKVVDNESEYVREWLSEIHSLGKAAVKPTKCRCLTRFQGFECPQSSYHDRIINTLTSLFKWRTDFWKDKNSVSQKQNELKDSIQALKTASQLLLQTIDDQGRERPIDLNRIYIDGERRHTLMRLFCSYAIQMTTKKYEQSWLESPKESDLGFAAALGEFAFLLLGEGEFTAQSIRNIVTVVADFGHRVLGIPARIDLVRHLRHTLRGESALHTLKQRYRDHFFHTLEVCFLGFVILMGVPQTDDANESPLISRIVGWAKPENHPDGASIDDTAVNDLLANWWIASLVHDTAYGIDILWGTTELLEFFTNHPGVHAIISATRDGIKEAGKSLSDFANTPDETVIPSQAIAKGDHGVIAAGSLMKLVSRIGKATAKRFDPAIRAIGFHNTRVPQINASADPIAAILVLCDTIQEWGRSTIGFDNSPSFMMSRIVSNPGESKKRKFGLVNQFGMNAEIAMNDTAGLMGRITWKSKTGLELHLDYSDEVLEECRAKFVWADMTYNLQRVDFSGWKECFRVAVTTPLKGDCVNNKFAKPQFEYVGEFIREQEVRFIEDWYVLAGKRDCNEAVAHLFVRREAIGGEWKECRELSSCETGFEYGERIWFNLACFGDLRQREVTLMGGDIGGFFDAIRQWTTFQKEQAHKPPASRRPV